MAVEGFDEESESLDPSSSAIGVGGSTSRRGVIGALTGVVLEAEDLRGPLPRRPKKEGLVECLSARGVLNFQVAPFSAQTGWPMKARSSTINSNF